MSNTGGDNGEGDTRLPPRDFQEVGHEDYDPATAMNGRPPPQPTVDPERNTETEGTQYTTAMEEAQQEGSQGAAPVHRAITRSPGTQSQGSSPGPAPSTSGNEPTRRSANWMDRIFGGRRRSSTSTATSTGNRPQRSNTSTTAGSRPVSLAEEPENPVPGASSDEIMGPTRARINSQSNSPQVGAEAAQGGATNGSRPTRTNTGLSINTDLGGLLQGIGVYEGPTPLGGPRGRPSAGGNSGSLPTTTVDPELEIRRRNHAFLELYDQLREHEVVVDEQDFQTRVARVTGWRFQLGADALEPLVNQGVAGVRDVVGAAAANIPRVLQDQIVGEARRGITAIRDMVTDALTDERNFVVNTTNDIITLIDNAAARRDRQRGSSRPSRAQSLASNASRPELPPMTRGALERRSRDDLVAIILNMDAERQETNEEVNRLEDEARQTQQTHEDELRRLGADMNTNQRRFNEEIQQAQEDRDYYEQQLGICRAEQARQGTVDQRPSRDNSEEPDEANETRPPAGSLPRSPDRQHVLQRFVNVMDRLLRHEILVRGCQGNAGVDTETLDDNATPFSANAQLSRAGLGLRLRDITAERNQIEQERNQAEQERDESRRNETRLLNRVQALERTQASPRVGSGLLGSLFRRNSERASLPNGSARSRSGSRAGPGSPVRVLSDELAAHDSGGSSGSSGPASSQSPRSVRQSRASSSRSGADDGPSVAGSRQSNAPSDYSDGDRTPPPGGEPAAVNPVPLRAIPEWLATHPNGPCGDCVPNFRFPPELGELPTCGCTCELALRNPPPNAGRSPRAASSRAASSRSASSRSRGSTGSGRNVRFADDEPAAEGSGGGRPAPLDLSAAGTNIEENNADRPDTPYPADAEGGQPGAPASGEQAEAGRAGGSAGESSAGVASAPREQAETVPILAPAGQATGEEGLLVEAPPVVEAAGRRGGRCPCCGRGAYGEPPAGGVPQVAFYVCRNMAGQPIPRAGDAPPDIFRGVMNALGLDPAGPRPAAAGGRGDRGDENPPLGPEPPDPGPEVALIPERVPRDGAMWYLTALWNFIAAVCLVPLLAARYFVAILFWFGAAVYSCCVYGWYLTMTHFAGWNVAVAPPLLARFPMWEALCVVLTVLVLWFATTIIAIFEERRIWRAANAQLSTAYFRGLASRRPYPWYQVFEADLRLLWPALGWLPEWLHRRHFP